MSQKTPVPPAEPVGLITGASKGIGSAIARTLARTGAFVYINYLSDKKAAEHTLDQVLTANGKGALLPFDITDPAAAQAAIKNIVKEKGRIDMLVNNAGIKADQLLAMMKKEAWQQVMDTNLNSFFNLTKPAVKAMIRQRAGRIVTLTSTAGQTGNAGQVNYSAAKAGLIGATRALSREVANRNITVNAVAPGFIQTRMTDDMDISVLVETIPAKRLGTPEEVADLVAFLCSHKAGYITGQVIGINGGMV
jgi:3-oxoacyl-[acyl-carrier protein] reductase